MLNKNQKTHYYSFFFYHPHPPRNYYDYYYYMQRLKESCNFLTSVPGLPCAQKVEEKEGEKTRNKFFRSNFYTIPNSQYNINFGWWLAFILLCLDKQIYYKNNNNIWVVTASSATKSELLSLTRTTTIFFLNHSLAKFPLKKFAVENIHHTSRFCQFGFTGKEITTFTVVCISEELMRR